MQEFGWREEIENGGTISGLFIADLLKDRYDHPPSEYCAEEIRVDGSVLQCLGHDGFRVVAACSEGLNCVPKHGNLLHAAHTIFVVHAAGAFSA